MNLVADIGAGAARRLEPEAAHAAALAALRCGLGPRVRADRWPRLRTSVAGLALPNPLGLAAGFDKDARAPDALLAAGFGWVECGTVTPRPQPGNPRPRLFRLPEDGAVINRMGFNSGGLTAFAARLAARAGRPGVVGANVGANKDSPDRIGDYVAGVTAAWPHAAYLTLNVSSPNTEGLRALQTRTALEELLGRLAPVRAGLTAAHGPRPVFLKLAPDLDDAAVLAVAEVATAGGVEALILTNTTTTRPAGLRGRHRGEAGGLSGRPLRELALARLRAFADATGGRLPLIGVGGIADAADALARIKAGASALQLYTALALQGPSLVARLMAELALRLEAEGFASVADAVGADHR